MEVFLLYFLTSVQHGDKWSRSCRRHPWREDSIGPKDGLDSFWMENYMALSGIESWLLVSPAPNLASTLADVSCITWYVGRKPQYNF
jgi:hypothetical protein